MVRAASSSTRLASATTAPAPQLAAGACPSNSLPGTAAAYSPLLDQPLGGNVYLVADGGARKLPDVEVVVALKGGENGLLQDSLDPAGRRPRGARLSARVTVLSVGTYGRLGATRKGATAMTGELKGKKVAILAADGVEQAEIEEPRKAVEAAGAESEVISIEDGEIQAVESDIYPSEKIAVDKSIGDASVDDYDGLILPGGVGNPDKLRKEGAVIEFVQEWFRAGKPVGVICHGPWTLVEADLVRGRTLTSYPSIRTDIRNAGGNVVDEEVVTDEGLVSSRDPDDLPGFCARIVEEFAEGKHEVHDEGATA